MSLKLDLYNAIYSAIDAVTTIETVELHNSQFDNEAKERVHKYPMATIEFSDMLWDITQQQTPQYLTNGNVTNQQKGTFLMTIHIGFKSYKDETASFTDIEPIIDDVYRALNMLEGNEYGPMLRVSEEQDVDHGSVIVWNITFKVPVFEKGEADTSLTDATDGQTVTLEITKDLDIDSQVIRSGDGE